MERKDNSSEFTKVCDGGYMVLKSEVPELQRQVKERTKQFLGMFAFRLLCGSGYIDRRE